MTVPFLSKRGHGLVPGIIVAGLFLSSCTGSAPTNGQDEDRKKIATTNPCKLITETEMSKIVRSPTEGRAERQGPQCSYEFENLVGVSTSLGVQTAKGGKQVQIGGLSGLQVEPGTTSCVLDIPLNKTDPGQTFGISTTTNPNEKRTGCQLANEIARAVYAGLPS